MTRATLLLACALSCVLGAASGEASNVTLALDPATAFRDGQASLAVRVANLGDEPASLLHVDAGFEDLTARSETVTRLEPGAEVLLKIPLGPPPLPAGTRTVRIRATCSNSAGASVGALAAVPLVTADPGMREDPVRMEVSDGSVQQSGAVRVRISSRSDRQLPGRIELLVPEGLAADQPVRDMLLPPRGERIETFRITNEGAPAGSRLAAVAIVDCGDGDRIASIFARSWIDVAASALPVIQHPWLVLPLAAVLLGWSLVRRRSRRDHAAPSRWERLLDAGIVVIALGSLLLLCASQMAPSEWLRDTVLTGGDTPAHNYMVSRARETLLGEGRIATWAAGWWCGFPLFQYYFSLPYVAAALASLLLPFNIAFKLVTVSGILLLPAAAYGAGRLARLPKPAPILLAILTLPILFDPAHSMWGVNIYSTLAGMIANSVSFPIMLLTLGSAWRDADDGVFRARTVLLMAALVASHFFTSLLAALTIASYPLVMPRSGYRRALGVLAAEAALAALLMAWWLIPLVTTREFSVDFGTNWNVPLLGQFMLYTAAVSPFALPALAAARDPRYRIVLPIAWMLICSILLFHFGWTYVSPVFVDVRLWPYIHFGVLALAAIGLGVALQRAARPRPAVLAVLLLTLAFGAPWPNDIAGWARWNYSGLESKPAWPAFRDLVLPLKGTAGRLAYDLHEDNNAMGSSRVFETVPYLIGKPILEGGIVNSAWGSLFAYYIQGETSDNPAGFPTRVQPGSFDIPTATRHLALFNVRHFIARSERTQKALDANPEWRLLRDADGWKLYELISNSGRHVFVPDTMPIPVVAADRQQAGLEWLYTSASLGQFYALLRPGDRPAEALGEPVPEARYLENLRSQRNGAPSALPARPVAAPAIAVRSEQVTDRSIRFRTDAVGLPHIIKCTYFPNWKMRDGGPVYMVTPGFMLVFPKTPEVELYYGFTLSDTVARWLTCAGALLLAGAALVARRAARSRRSS